MYTNCDILHSHTCMKHGKALQKQMLVMGSLYIVVHRDELDFPPIQHVVLLGEPLEGLANALVWLVVNADNLAFAAALHGRVVVQPDCGPLQSKTAMANGCTLPTKSFSATTVDMQKTDHPC